MFVHISTYKLRNNSLNKRSLPEVVYYNDINKQSLLYLAFFPVGGAYDRAWPDFFQKDV